MISVLQVLLLAVVQGLTEFLPVSSSGHLVLFQQMLGTSLDVGDTMAMDVALHLGTLVPVLWFYRRDVAGLAERGLRPGPLGSSARRYIGYILAASVPTAVIGLGLEDQFKSLFSSTRAVGAALLVTAALLVASRVFERAAPPPGADAEQDPTGITLGLSLPVVLIIGVAQGFAITPGISRSGATIAIALMLGVHRSAAARFSFLLSIPAIGGAALLELTDAAGALRWDLLGIGFAAAALTGYAALWMLVKLVDRGRFWVFAPYVAAVGLAALILG